MKYRAKGKLVNHKYQVLIHDTRGHSSVMDLPKDMGGHDTGGSPLDFVTEALAGCTVIVFQMIAQKMKVKVNDMKVIVTAEKGELTLESAKVKVVVDSPADEGILQQILEKTEEQCPVGAILEKAGIPEKMELVVQNREEFCEDS